MVDYSIRVFCVVSELWSMEVAGDLGEILYVLCICVCRLIEPHFLVEVLAVDRV